MKDCGPPAGGEPQVVCRLKGMLPETSVSLLRVVKRLLGELGYIVVSLERCKHPDEFLAVYPPVRSKGMLSQAGTQLRSLIVRTFGASCVRIRTIERPSSLEAAHREFIAQTCGKRVLFSGWPYNHPKKKGKPRRWIELVKKSEREVLLSSLGLNFKNASS